MDWILKHLALDMPHNLHHISIIVCQYVSYVHRSYEFVSCLNMFI
jgi:hypothetical protein